MTKKEQYRHFCSKQKDIPIFSQPWHLDAVIQEGAWDVVLVEKGGKVVASMPYYYKKAGPFQYITLPLLTKTMGPYLLPAFRNSKHEYSLLNQLIDQLPQVAYFDQNMHYDLSNWLPFYWKKYQQTTCYSYTIDPLNNLDQVYSNFCGGYRNNKIKKAQQKVTVHMDRSLEDFYRIKKMSFTRQGLGFPFSFDYFQQYDEVLAAQQARQMFFAVDEKNQIHSVVYLIWDGRSAYYHLAGDDPALRNSGAGILLVWEAIQYTKNVLKLDCFDFEGSMIPSIEKVRRNFGAHPKPYFNIRKYHSKTFQFIHGIKKLF